MQSARTWIVVADSARARIFVTDDRGEDWQQVEAIDHPQARAKTPELVTAMPAMERGELPKEREAKVFARQLSGKLEAAFHTRQFQQLVLVAPPEMMGHLRRSLPAAVAQVVAHEITKDLSQLKQDELEERVASW